MRSSSCICWSGYSKRLYEQRISTLYCVLLLKV